MWSDHAECKDHSEDLWFGFGEGTTKEAKAICNVCPVEEECLEDALAQPSTSDFGIREAARAVAFCDSCGEPTHEPNEDCWFMDRSSCAYALNPNGGGTCSFDCRDEPSCMTDGPYPMERLRLVLAAADRGVTDGEATDG